MKVNTKRWAAIAALTGVAIAGFAVARALDQVRTGGPPTVIAPLQSGEDPIAWRQRAFDNLRGVGEGPLHRGNPGQAMAQARELMKAWQAAGGDWDKIDPELLTLPDQQFVPDPKMRTSQSFTRNSDPVARKYFPEYHELAFVSPIYTELLSDFRRGVEGDSRLVGFHIVGYVNGTVEQVPVEKIRVMPVYRRGVAGQRYVYPGQAEYGPDAPLMHDREGVRAAWARLDEARNAP